MDSLVKKLNELGYQPVFLPRTNVNPPELHSYSTDLGRLVRHGPLLDYLQTSADIRVDDGALANIEYQYTSSKKVEAAAKFLEASLKCIGITSIPKISLGFAGAQDFSFAFKNVTYRKVDPSKIGQLVQSIATDGIPQKIIESGRLHVVYEYIYANELIMSRGDKKEFSEDISGKVADFIDIGIKGAVSVQSKSTISFKGAESERAAFAFMAGYLTLDDDGWEFHPEEIRRGPNDDARKYVPQRGVVLTIDEG